MEVPQTPEGIPNRDPNVLYARKICAEECLAIGAVLLAADYSAGTRDHTLAMRAAYTALENAGWVYAS